MIYAIVSGAGGQLGKAFIHQLSYEDGFGLFSFDKGQLDIAESDKINRLLDALPQAKYWINCAAYTKVDDAETNEELAYLYNAVAPGYIAEACKQRGLHLIHFSSDYVYHNGLHRPLRESDPTSPQGVYAKSKLEGEKIIQLNGVSHTILRTSWVFGHGGHNFVNTMLRLGRVRPSLSIVGDQLGAPTYTDDIVKACEDILRKCDAGQQLEWNGIFNFANAGEVTWDNFARTIFKETGIECDIKTISTLEYNAPAPRPSYSVLDCSKIQAQLSFPIPSWENALSRYLLRV